MEKRTSVGVNQLSMTETSTSYKSGPVILIVIH